MFDYLPYLEKFGIVVYFVCDMFYYQKYFIYDLYFFIFAK